MHPADTDLTPVDLGSYSSRVTLMCGNAAIQAADAAARRRSLEAVGAEARGRAGALVFARPQGRRARRLGQGRAVRARPSSSAEAMHGVLGVPRLLRAAQARRASTRAAASGPSPCYSYSACVVELTVDEETGDGSSSTRSGSRHDIGRALNPLLVEGQVEGSVYMGIGEALMEGAGLPQGPAQASRRCSSTRARPRWRRRRSTRSWSRPTIPRGRSAPRRRGRGRCCR